MNENKMKIGIMSMQRVVNYGSFMQSYALKKCLENMGAEVSMVDYHIGNALVKELDMKKPSSAEQLISKIQNNLAFAKKNDKATMDRFWNMYARMEEGYITKMLPLLGVTESRNYNPELDLLIIGSDEVFNCLQPNPEVGYSKELFGHDNKAKKLISYAASFGNTVEGGLKKYGIYDEVREMLSRFDDISVRDENSLRIVEGMGLSNISKNVDPVFLYDFTDEASAEVPIKDYIVVYSYRCRISKRESAAIMKFAKKHKKKIVCIEGVQRFLDGFIALDNPFDVYAYFRNADYIITDTFHGTVFSIKNNKKFVSIVRSGTESNYGNSSKMNDLLKTFGLEDRRLTKLNELDEKINSPIDYERVNKIVSDEREKALKYISKYVVQRV
jgi:polysaccharide pyruvyl transferase WcaK-like protein